MCVSLFSACATGTPSRTAMSIDDLEYFQTDCKIAQQQIDVKNQIKKLQDFLCPRVYCYFDDVFSSNYGICEFNGELLAIKEFNELNADLKIANSLDSVIDFRFPLAKNMLWLMHNFGHKDYNKNIGRDHELSLGSLSSNGEIF